MPCYAMFRPLGVIESDLNDQVASERIVAWRCSKLQGILGGAASDLRILRGLGSVTYLLSCFIDDLSRS